MDIQSKTNFAIFSGELSLRFDVYDIIVTSYELVGAYMVDTDKGVKNLYIGTKNIVVGALQEIHGIAHLHRKQCYKKKKC